MKKELINLDQIFGQDAAVEALSSAYKVDRLPHGLIFAGPSGVGKGTTAQALAGLFLCEKPMQLAACGKCASCVAFAAGNHPDYHLIYRQLARLESDKVKARDLSAAVIRDFLNKVAGNKSVVGVGKVFVIEEAETMNATAQNSMLKTLEEPAGRTLIILLTDQPGALLSTIRSRCRVVQFAALDQSLVRTKLQQQHAMTKEVAAAAAQFTEGSLGLALKWHEDGVIDRAMDLNQRLKRIASGSSASDLQEWLKGSADAYAEKQLERDDRASKDQVSREGLVLYLKLIAQFFRRRLVAVNDDAEQLERMCAAIDAVVAAEGYVDANVNVALVLQQFTGAMDRALQVQPLLAR